MPTMYGLITVGIAIALFLGLLLFVELGRRLGIKQTKKRGDGARAGVGGVDSVVYSLLGLLIGFTFSGAAGRFDKRRELTVREVNAISTAWQRIDLMSPDQQPGFRDAFRGYVDALIAVHRETPGTDEDQRGRVALAKAQNDVWSRGVTSSLDPNGEKARMLILPAVNEMFDVVDTERLAQQLHPPMIIYMMLSLAAFAGAMFAGYAMSNTTPRNWVHIIGMAATISIASYVILELEAPRLGLIRVDSTDRALIELRETMDDPTESAMTRR